MKKAVIRRRTFKDSLDREYVRSERIDAPVGKGADKAGSEGEVTFSPSADKSFLEEVGAWKGKAVSVHETADVSLFYLDDGERERVRVDWTEGKITLQVLAVGHNHFGPRSIYRTKQVLVSQSGESFPYASIVHGRVSLGKIKETTRTERFLSHTISEETYIARPHLESLAGEYLSPFGRVGDTPPPKTIVRAFLDRFLKAGCQRRLTDKIADVVWYIDAPEHNAKLQLDRFICRLRAASLSCRLAGRSVAHTTKLVPTVTSRDVTDVSLVPYDKGILLPQTRKVTYVKGKRLP